MKSKAFLTAGLTAISLLSAFPTMTAFAGSSSIPTVALRTKRKIFSYKIQKPLLKRNLKKDA